MKVRVTGRGIYGADGMVPIGTEVEVPSIPKGWASRCEVVGGSKGKTMIVNPEGEQEEEEIEPSKADLIAQAEELGIEVKKSWTKEKLQEEIDAALEV